MFEIIRSKLKIHEPSSRQKLATAFFVGFLLLVVTFFVYFTGGSYRVFAHSMYIPIVIAALMFSARGGIITGLVGGFLLGPFMPLNVAEGTMQTPINWLFRMGFFVSIGGIVGLFKESLNKHFNMVLKARNTLNNTNLTLSNKLYEDWRDMDAEKQKEFSYVHLRVSNYEEIVDFIGPLTYRSILQKAHDRLTEYLPDSTRIYANDALSLIIALKTDSLKAYLDFITELFRESIIHGDVPVLLEVHLGAATFHETLDNTLNQASLAASHAKLNGLEYSVYDETQSKSKADIEIIGSFRDAIDRNELYLVFQPKVGSSTGEGAHVEALIRWKHPTFGELSPDEFIPLIEQSSLISDMTRWIIDESLKTINHAKQNGIPLHVAINISARNLLEDDFADDIMASLNRYDVTPEKLELEITESALMAQPEASIEALKTLKDYGFTLAIDDFGTGFSSLSYLKDFPVHRIKIAKEFVHDLDTDEKSLAILKAMVELSESLGIMTLAEGVETKLQADLLKSAGCNEYQGFFYAHPMTFATLKRHLTDEKRIER